MNDRKEFIMTEKLSHPLTEQLESALETNAFNQVQQLADQMIAEQIDMDAAYNALAILELEHHQNVEQARMYYEQAILHNDQSATLHYNLGMLYDQFLADTTTAMSYYEQAIELDSTYVDAYVELIELGLETQQDLTQVMTYAEIAESLAPDNPRLLNNIGCLHLRQHRNYQQAVVYFERALLQTENKALIAANLADVYVRLAEYKKAKKAYELSLTHDPNNALICHNFAHLLQHQIQDYDLAKHWYQRAISLAPTEVHPYIGLKNLLVHQLKLPKDAIMLLEEGLNQVNQPVRLELELADLYDLVLEDFDQAVYYYKRVLLQQPKNLTVLNALAYLSVQVFKTYDQALRYYEQVLEVDPHTPITYVNIGHVYFLKLANFDQALYYYEKANELIKQHGHTVPYADELHLNLGMLYEDYYQQQLKAMAHYEQAVALKANKKAEKKLLRLYEVISKPLISQIIS